MTDYRNIEEKISAYLDNQMSEADRAAFEVEMDGDPELVAPIVACTMIVVCGFVVNWLRP